MGGHGEHHEEDHSVPMKVGAVIIFTFLIIVQIAVL